MMIFASLALALAPVPQAVVAPSPVTAIDPARLAAARATIDVVMPPAQRDTMVDSMIKPMMATIVQSALSAPSLKGKLESDPAMRAVFERFMTRQTDRTTERLRVGMPGMVDAMARAYARRFTVAQLGEIRTFFSTPTGSYYMAQSFAIMSDPDIQAWQRQLMQSAMGNVENDMRELIAELEAAEKAK